MHMNECSTSCLLPSSGGSSCGWRSKYGICRSFAAILLPRWALRDLTCALLWVSAVCVHYLWRARAGAAIIGFLHTSHILPDVGKGLPLSIAIPLHGIHQPHLAAGCLIPFTIPPISPLTPLTISCCKLQASRSSNEPPGPELDRRDTIAAERKWLRR